MMPFPSLLPTQENENIVYVAPLRKPYIYNFQIESLPPSFHQMLGRPLTLFGTDDLRVYLLVETT